MTSNQDDPIQLDAIGRWIPVEDEVPQGYPTPVLFWVSEEKPYEHQPIGCYAGYFYDNDQASHFDDYDKNREPGIWFGLDGQRIYSKVSHWMPYPSGPGGRVKTGQEVHVWR